MFSPFAYGVATQRVLRGVLLLVLFVSLLPRAAYAAEGGPATVFDLNTTPTTARTEYAAMMKGSLYFLSRSYNNGGLWKTDGTPAGTTLVYGKLPLFDYSGDWGIDYVEIGAMFATPNLLYFTLLSGGALSLWRSDGTEAGTFRLCEIDYMEYYWDFYNQAHVATIGDTLFFNRYDPTHGTELWKTNGTRAGTVLVKDICTGGCGSDAFWKIAAGNLVYFFANDGIHGNELWKSDGTAAGTVLVKDINPGKVSSRTRDEYLNGLTHYNPVDKHIYLPADDGIHGEELWTSDGTTAGTVLVKDTDPGMRDGNIYEISDVNGLTIFVNESGELWRTDGTEAGTSELLSMVDGQPQAGNISLYGYGFELVIMDGFAYFSASTAPTGTELWRTDGTVAGTTLVADIVPGQRGSRPLPIRSINHTLYLSATDPAHGTDLWRSDGTAAGTTMVADHKQASDRAFFMSVFEVGNAVFANVFDSDTSFPLWQFSKTSSVATPVASWLKVNQDSYPIVFAAVHDVLYTVLASNSQLWRSDGTKAGTYPLRTKAGAALSTECLTVMRDTLYFAGRSNANDYGLWRSDGTPAGTWQVKAFPDTSSYSCRIENIAGTLFLSKRASQTATNELWKSDGTAAGTSKFKDVQGFVGTFVGVSGRVFFISDTELNGYEVWVTDGTAAGTHMVKDIAPGSNSSNPQSLTMLGNTVFFTADDGTNGRELWKSDGTAAGTAMVKDLAIDPSKLGPSDLAVFNGALFFSGYYIAGGIERRVLWKSDGTAAGTVMIKDATQPATPSTSSALAKFDPALLMVKGQTLFFTAYGSELWKSDGTTAGTVRVAAFEPASVQKQDRIYSSFPQSLVAYNGILYCMVNAPLTGGDIWRSDGTAAGTYRLPIGNVGWGLYVDPHVQVAGTNLFFPAGTQATGTELAVYSLLDHRAYAPMAQR